MAVGQNPWYHFEVGAPPILVNFSGDWDVYWGYDLDSDPWPDEQLICHQSQQISNFRAHEATTRKLTVGWPNKDGQLVRRSARKACDCSALPCVRMLRGQLSGREDLSGPAGRRGRRGRKRWLKIEQERLRGFWSMFPLTRVPFWYRSFWVGLLKNRRPLVYLVAQSSTRAIYFPKRTPMGVEE